MAIPRFHPQTEDYWGHVNPIGPRSCYDEGKRCAETLFFDYRRQLGLRSRSRASSTPRALECTNSPDEVTGPINIGNPDEMSIRELAELIITKTGSESELKACDLPADDPKQRQPDISRARQLLDWEPVVTLDQGLEKTID